MKSPLYKAFKNQSYEILGYLLKNGATVAKYVG
jgi:hypothetical protein